MTLTRFAPSRHAAPGLKASFPIEDPSTVVVVRGEVDVAAVPDLVDMLACVFGTFDGPVVVDLAETKFIDTAAMRVLARARQFLGDHGRQLTLLVATKTGRRTPDILWAFRPGHAPTRMSSATSADRLESKTLPSRPVIGSVSRSPA